jgi:hypothetical protein
LKHSYKLGLASTKHNLTLSTTFFEIYFLKPSTTSVPFPAANESVHALGEFAGIAAFEHGKTG